MSTVYDVTQNSITSGDFIYCLQYTASFLENKLYLVPILIAWIRAAWGVFGEG